MGQKYKVSVQNTDGLKSDISFNCDEDVSVLHAMIHAGQGPIWHGCCGGACGVCKARIISGDFYAFKPMSAAHVSETEKKEGMVLLCCVQPRSDMLIAQG
ncbi:hypothetical protein AGMMS50293_02940 [Spirochaetia bacterium]|nr:hypothetical protein AGMMS50293_02940 [Spirochaetia bacterium]